MKLHRRRHHHHRYHQGSSRDLDQKHFKKQYSLSRVFCVCASPDDVLDEELTETDLSSSQVSSCGRDDTDDSDEKRSTVDTILCDDEDNDNNEERQEPESDDKLLAMRFPNSTPAERSRFLCGRSLNKASLKMAKYMIWRRQNHLDDYYNTDESSLSDISDQQRQQQQRWNGSHNTDRDLWNAAVTFALSKFPDVKLPSKSLPRIVRFSHSTGTTNDDDNNKDEEDIRALNGQRIIQVLPCLIDTDLAPAEFFSLAIALYVDSKLDRNSLERVYLVLDVRSGDSHWPNPSTAKLMPFVKNLNENLTYNFPERLSKCIIYPVPPPAKVVWALYKSFLNHKHVEKVKILWGYTLVSSPVPKQKLLKYFDEETIDALEMSRCSEFL